jgi:hypothetical protein
MSPPGFYETGKVAQVAINLFYGWGYNFYRLENQLRADDLMVRARVSELLGSAREAVGTAEANYRRQFLPPPSREHPRPDPEAVNGARILESIGGEIGALEGRIRSLPVPEQDRMTQRLRQEAETLVRLRSEDELLAGHADLLREMLQANDGPWILEHANEIRGGLTAMTSAIERRRKILAP